MFYLLYGFCLSHVEGDQAFLLYAAQQVLAGVQLDGPRLIETNPPLIVWFSEVPVGLAHILHADPVMALRVVILALLAGSAVWGARILRLSRVTEFFGASTARLLWAITFFLVLIIQPAEFGQREQILLALFMPYVLAVGSSAVEKLSIMERVALGLSAGLGICFKPHHVLTVVGLELFLVLYRRSVRRLWSPDALALIGAGLIYIGAVRVFTPTYITVIMPLLTDTYWALGQYTFADMTFHVGVLETLSVVAEAAVWWALRRRLKCPQLEGALLASATGAVFAYFFQHTGWYHQAFPAVVLCEMAASWLLLDLLRIPEWQHVSRRVWVAAAVCGMLAFAVVLVRKRNAKLGEAPTINSELATYPPATTVYAFTLSMSHFPVVLQHGLVWGSRFAHLWMMPAIVDNEVHEHPAGRPFKALPSKRITELATLQRTETVQDLWRTRPKVVFVERCDTKHMCDSYTAPFDAVQWFSQNEAFAKLWSQYRFEKPVKDFDVYVRRE